MPKAGVQGPVLATVDPERSSWAPMVLKGPCGEPTVHLNGGLARLPLGYRGINLTPPFLYRIAPNHFIERLLTSPFDIRLFEEAGIKVLGKLP